MTQAEIISILANKRKGSFLRITYTSECKVASAYKDKYQVNKIVETTVRWGCNYSNLKAVKLKREEQAKLIALGQAQPPKQREAWWAWEQGHENVLKRHKESGQQYLTVEPVNNCRTTKVRYFVNGKVISKDELQSMGIIINSYWNNTAVDIYDIKLENILNIKESK